MTLRDMGSLQRKLLVALEHHPALFLADLLARPYTNSQYVSLRFAARTLHARGLLNIWRGDLGGTNSVWVTRVGYECTRKQVPRLTAEVVIEVERINATQSLR
jgi:hypothetical protein